MFKIIISFFIINVLLHSSSSYAASAEKQPILILGSPGRFDTYTGEILKAEGFNEFVIGSIADPQISLSYLKRYNMVIITETPITDRQTIIFSAYVQAGGNLVAFRPDKKLLPILGIQDEKEMISSAYIAIDAASAIGKGLIADPLQFHGEADAYLLKGAKKVASIYKKGDDRIQYPAVSVNEYGRGRTITFAYNLPESISLTRQGNPLFAGQEKDSITGLRAMDLFTYGWVDTSKNTFNQADEQMRLLSHCIEWISSFSAPLPRFWYFPDTLQCLVMLNNDGENSIEKEFEPQFADIEAKGAKMTLYILETDKVSKTATDSWAKRGHEISGHPDDTENATHPDWLNMNTAINTKLAELKSRFDIPRMSTIVNHWFVWCGNNENGKQDFTAQAKIEASKKIGMDINYAHYDNGSNQFRFLGPLGNEQGNYTGSGLPLKFADENGKLVDIYQALNNVYDQQYMENKDSLGFFNCFKGLMDRSLNGSAYSYITLKCHNNEYFFSKVPLSRMLDYANEKGIPVWTCAKILDFLKAKDEASFKNISWSADKLSFNIHSSLTHSNGITCMIPYRFNGKEIREIAVGGLKSAYSIKNIKGSDYAFLTIKPGYDYQMTVKYAH
ncbi:MAG: hypothetical protein ABI687_05275 [Flavitalea sp.]